MVKLFSAFAALAMVAGLAVAPQAAQATMHGIGHHRCGRGSHWVPAHRNRMGRWIFGHCARR
jgi:hypothetical protein